jgi:hypothetical protein
MELADTVRLTPSAILMDVSLKLQIDQDEGLLQEFLCVLTGMNSGRS